MMVGLTEFWWVPDAVGRGAGSWVMAALVTWPQLIGALGAVGMLRGLNRAPARKPAVLVAVALQASGLLALGAGTLSGLTSPWWLVLASCWHQLMGQAAGTAWSSWYGEVVPPRLRGRWFGGRSRFVHATTFLGMLLGALVLERAAGTATFGWLYLAAGAVRLGSLPLLGLAWEPAWSPSAPGQGLRALVTDPAAAPARRVATAGAALLFTVCLCTPFFGPHMLRDLGFDVPTYLAAQGALVAAKVGSLGWWGRRVDRQGAVPTWRLAALLVALVPVPWAFATDPHHWPIVFLAQVLSGLAWGGHEVSFLAMTLGALEPRRRATLLAAQSVLNGLAQVGGASLGGALMAYTGAAHAWAFAGSAALRLLAGGWAGRRIPRIEAKTQAVHLPARVTGWVPHGGVTRVGVATDLEDEPTELRAGPVGQRRPST